MTKIKFSLKDIYLLEKKCIFTYFIKVKKIM
jgi:hypothetical protein